MKILWSFIFADPKEKICSARVKADNRAEACAIMESVLLKRLNPVVHNPAANVILRQMGKMDGDSGIVSVVARDEAS